MALPPVRAVPSIPGWITHRDHTDQKLVASRVTNLSPYQVKYGCLSEIRADDPQELVWLCTGQTVLAEMAVTAHLEAKGAGAQEVEDSRARQVLAFVDKEIAAGNTIAVIHPNGDVHEVEVAP